MAAVCAGTSKQKLADHGHCMASNDNNEQALVEGASRQAVFGRQMTEEHGQQNMGAQADTQHASLQLLSSVATWSANVAPACVSGVAGQGCGWRPAGDSRALGAGCGCPD